MDENIKIDEFRKEIQKIVDKYKKDLSNPQMVSCLKKITSYLIANSISF
tara:strand:+ start:105 stop:251 length:147 start_codon:yes stop_codon:yes gene_type:complete